MTALNELRRHLGLDWKKLGREELTGHLEKSIRRIEGEQEKLAARMGASSVQEMEKLYMSGNLRGKDAAAAMHQYTRMCSLVRLARQAQEELKAPDPDVIEDEFEGIKQY
ncbi:MAG: hypothetical protein HYY32_05145 [Chloroflexi bacterium]|nr:hypothetical protein [Chloroflexota bacterium]